MNKENLWEIFNSVKTVNVQVIGVKGDLNPKA
jgi:hypothetical protein